MKRANPQNVFGLCLLLLVCVGWTVSASAQPEPIEPSPAQEQWVDRFIDFINAERSHEDLLNEQRLVRTALRPFQLKPNQLREFDRSGVARIMLGTMRQMVTDQNGNLTFLRFRDIDGQRIAMFRFISDSGINYIEWYLEETPDGKVLTWDYHSFSTGERASEILRRMWTPAVADMDPEIKKHMGKDNRELAEHLDDIIGIQQAFLQGDLAKAVDLYNKLPESLQINKQTMMLVMNARFQAGDMDGYAAMLERFAEAYPNAANLEIAYIDYHFINEQYDEVLKMVESLDRRVGGDIYLNVYRANVAYHRGDYAKACELIDEGLDEDRWLEDLYWSGVEFAMSQNDWPRVSKMLTGLEAIGVELLDLTELDYYADYVTTDEYERWQAARNPAVEE